MAAERGRKRVELRALAALEGGLGREEIGIGLGRAAPGAATATGADAAAAMAPQQAHGVIVRIAAWARTTGIVVRRV